MPTQAQLDAFAAMSPEEQAALTAYINGQKDQVRTMYPQYAWALDIEGLGDILLQAAAEQWDQGRITAAVQATEWWKARNSAQREQEQLYRSDPASWNQAKNGIKTQVLQFARRNGVQMSDAEAEYIAFEAITKGRSTEEWQASVVTEFLGNRGATPAPVANNLKALAAEYAVPMSDATLNKWSSDILTGMVDENTFRAYLIEQAKSLFPGLANALDRGITVRQYVAPYQELAVQELGINPADIDWRDPKWSAAIHRIDAKTGAPASMSLSDWTRELRSNPIYGFDQTIRATEMASQLGWAIRERFGAAA